MLIGLHGKKQAGKDTVHRRIEAIYGKSSACGATVERVAFADLLYRSAAEALGVTVDFLQRAKADPQSKVVAFSVEDGFASEITVREYLQRYGTEAHRAIFSDNFWVEQVNLRDHEGKVVVVTDVRFPNEATAVFNAGGVVVQVLGPEDIEDAGDGHASEEPLPAYQVDYVLRNTRRDDYFVSLDAAIRLLMAQLHTDGRMT